MPSYLDSCSRVGCLSCHMFQLPGQLLLDMRQSSCGHGCPVSSSMSPDQFHNCTRCPHLMSRLTILSRSGHPSSLCVSTSSKNASNPSRRRFSRSDAESRIPTNAESPCSRICRATDIPIGESPAVITQTRGSLCIGKCERLALEAGWSWSWS